jgi:hypothetical protein
MTTRVAIYARVSTVNQGQDVSMQTRDSPSNYSATFFAFFLTFAHRSFAAFTIAALPAADRTRFFTPTTSRSAECPNAFAAARTPLSW